MPVTCTASSLAAESACLKGLSPDEQEAVKIYLLALAAGVDPNPETLAAAAACFSGIPPAQQQAIQIYLLCRIVNGESSPEVLLEDFFDRADNPSSLGNADIGGAWMVASGVWGISSSQAMAPTGPSMALLNAGDSDTTAQVTLATIDGLPGLVFRFDSNSYWYVAPILGTYFLRKVIAGVVSSSTSLGGTPSNGDILKVISSGSSIQVLVNGSQVGSTVNDGFNSTATTYGMIQALTSPAAPTARWDDFLVTTP